MEPKVTLLQLLLMVRVIESGDIRSQPRIKDIRHFQGFSSTTYCSKLDFCGSSPINITGTELIISTNSCSILRFYNANIYSCCKKLPPHSKADSCNLGTCAGYPHSLFTELKGYFNIIRIVYVCGNIIEEYKKEEDSTEKNDFPVAGNVVFGLMLALVAIGGTIALVKWRQKKHALKATETIPFSESRDGSNMQNNTHELAEYHHSDEFEDGTSNTRIALCLHVNETEPANRVDTYITPIHNENAEPEEGTSKFQVATSSRINETVPAKRDDTYITPLHNEYAEIEEGTSNLQVATNSHGNETVPANTDDNYITPLHYEYAEIEEGASNTQIAPSSCSNEYLPAKTDSSYILVIPIL